MLKISIAITKQDTYQRHDSASQYCNKGFCKQTGDPVHHHSCIFMSE